jgi:hypothetical protein
MAAKSSDSVALPFRSRSSDRLALHLGPSPQLNGQNGTALTCYVHTHVGLSASFTSIVTLAVCRR